MSRLWPSSNQPLLEAPAKNALWACPKQPLVHGETNVPREIAPATHFSQAATPLWGCPGKVQEGRCPAALRYGLCRSRPSPGDPVLDVVEKALRHERVLVQVDQVGCLGEARTQSPRCTATPPASPRGPQLLQLPQPNPEWKNEGWTPTLHLSTLPCFPLPRTEVWAAFPWLFGKIPVVSRPSMELGAVQEVYGR